MQKNTLLLFTCMIATLTLSGCGGSDDPQQEEQAPVVAPPDTAPPDANTPFQELFNQGIDRYLGMFVPTAFENSNIGGTLHYFDVDPEQGPMCYTGNQFYMATRDGSAQELLVFVEGGGACSEASCELAVDRPFPGGVPRRGIMNPNDSMNALANFDMAYIPYCDGSFHAGDANHDSDGDGSVDRFFRGIQNLSASLDVIFNAYPAPAKIVLAGNSAGGMGTHFALPLLRKLYPLVPIELINDSGMGIAQSGNLEAAFDYWGASDFFPSSCENCFGDDGNLTGYHSYQLAADDNLRMAFISTKQDSTVVDSSAMLPEQFEAELLEAVAELETTYPSRFGALIANGDGHTFLQRNYNTAIGNTMVSQWVADFITDSSSWMTVIEEQSSDPSPSPTNLLRLQHDGLERRYLLTIPSQYSANTPIPLVFNFHPLGGSAQQIFNVSQLDVVAEQENFILVTPEGVDRAWAVTGFPLGGNADDIGFVEAMIDQLLLSYAVDPNRIYATGFSNGGFLTFDLACKLSDRFAAVAPVSGIMTPTLIETCMPERAVPVLQTHGTEDPLLPYSFATQSIDWWVTFNQTNAQALISDLPDPFPANGTSVQRYIYSDGVDGISVQHLRIEEGEHDWPGSVGDSEIDMAKEIWEFLRQYDLNGVIIN